MKRKYLALSFVEILIVLGGLVILSSIGLIGTRYALEKSREAHYKSNVRLLYTALVNFKNDYGRYPLLNKYPNEGRIYEDCDRTNGCIENDFFRIALAVGGRKAILRPYLKEPFDGGLRAIYYYYVQETDGQFVIVCVSLGGAKEREIKGYYCEGDGIGLLPPGDPVQKMEIDCSSRNRQNNDHECEIIGEKMDPSVWNKGRFSSL